MKNYGGFCEHVRSGWALERGECWRCDLFAQLQEVSSGQWTALACGVGVVVFGCVVALWRAKR